MSLLLMEERRGRRVLLTKNLSPGKRVYNEELLLKDGVEYRTWDPFRSKLAAAILKGLPGDVVSEGAKVLYLGASTGTTASHVSDLVGARGLVIGVEFAPRVAREFMENVVRERSNVIPYVSDARDPAKYSIAKVDVVYCDIAQPDQTEIAIANCARLLKSIDVLKEPEQVFAEEKERLQRAGFRVKAIIELSPFDKDHALIHALN
jgi:fibrillarin-like pre-rRNA processing protein